MVLYLAFFSFAYSLLLLPLPVAKRNELGEDNKKGVDENRTEWDGGTGRALIPEP